MADRTRYLLAYDIAHPKRLRRINKVAKTFGYPLQYSVFVCDLDGVELVAMRTALVAEMVVSEDSIGIFDLGPPRGRALRCVEFVGVRRELPEDGPTVW